MRLGLFVLVLFAAAAPTGVSSREPAPPDLAAMLDAYAARDFAAALRPLERVSPDEAGDYRLELTSTAGLAWIARVPDDRSRRTLIAAAFALEGEAVLAERGLWARATTERQCAGRCVLEWACDLIRLRLQPDEAERIWMLASIALLGGVRNWSALLSPVSAPRPRQRVQGHVLHALDRFPDEPRFKLARAVAIASRHAVMSEMDAPRARQRTEPATPPMVITSGSGPANPIIMEFLRPGTDYATQQLGLLLDDPAVGAEARMRLAYVHLQSGGYEFALDEARTAAKASPDTDVRYLAHHIAGHATQTLGDLAGAEQHYRAALDARPAAQSATLALAALLHARGDGNTASDLVAASIAARPPAPDPWRLFLYGDFPRLPSLIAELRKAVAQ